MRKGWLIFFWLLTIVIVLILLIFVEAKGKTGNIIQSIAIITLVFVTWFYAKQAQKLVEQEKKSLDEEKKRRTVDFWKSRLTEFFIPLKINLKKLQEIVKPEHFSPDEFSKAISEFIELMNKAYMLSPDINNSLISFVSMFEFQRRDKLYEGDGYNINERAEELLKKVNIEIRTIEYKINEIYGFKIDKKLQEFIKKVRVEIYSGRG